METVPLGRAAAWLLLVVLAEDLEEDVVGVVAAVVAEDAVAEGAVVVVEEAVAVVAAAELELV